MDKWKFILSFFEKVINIYIFTYYLYIMSNIKIKEVAKKKVFPKRERKRAVRQVDMNLFVRAFYQKYGKMMSQLSHE